MAFTEGLYNASSFKKHEEKNNLKFPGRRSRHPLKGEVVFSKNMHKYRHSCQVIPHAIIPISD